ncbi:MAG: hypothetical protein M3Y87_33485, partial [Myxococcota bacterium]|nr:hypothetical protein [Myxococcota bacterium]
MLVELGRARNGLRFGGMVAVVVALVAGACGSDPGPSDPADGGRRDGGDPGIDAGPGPDAGPGSDGGGSDAGSVGDAGVDGGGPVSMP